MRRRWTRERGWWLTLGLVLTGAGIVFWLTPGYGWVYAIWIAFPGPIMVGIALFSRGRGDVSGGKRSTLPRD